MTDQKCKAGVYEDGTLFFQPLQYMTSVGGAKLPLSEAAFVARCQQICGCKNVIGSNCDCVSVGNKASVELWTEHNKRNQP